MVLVLSSSSSSPAPQHFVFYSRKEQCELAQVCLKRITGLVDSDCRWLEKIKQVSLSKVSIKPSHLVEDNRFDTLDHISFFTKSFTIQPLDHVTTKQQHYVISAHGLQGYRVLSQSGVYEPSASPCTHNGPFVLGRREHCWFGFSRSILWSKKANYYTISRNVMQFHLFSLNIFRHIGHAFYLKSRFILNFLLELDIRKSGGTWPRHWITLPSIRNIKGLWIKDPLTTRTRLTDVYTTVHCAQKNT